MSQIEIELINYNENLPFKIYILDVKNFEYHIHKEIELVSVLKGTAIYEVKNKKYKLIERDLFLVNSFEVHSIKSEVDETLLLVLQLNPFYFNQYCPDFSDFYFEPSISLSDSNSLLNKKINSNLAKIMLSLIKQNISYKLETVNSAIEIAITLVKSCRTELRNENEDYLYKHHRISELLKYIEENYSSKIGLDNLSKEIHVSPKYISSFFKNNLGIGFVDYVNKLRITKSLTDLLGSKKSILDIAIEYGFNDHKTYNRVFKKEFGMTATDYKSKSSRSINAENLQIQNNYFSDYSKDYFKYLFKFIENDKADLIHVSTITDKLNINIDLTKSSNKKLIKYWNKITSVERASLCLRSEIQSQIKKAQKELGYEFIRFHGIFSDEMMVYREDAFGNSIYNWNYIDEIFDFFCRINLKPFIEIGFMPEVLASKKQYSDFFWKPNVSYPKSMKKWSDLISEFIKHCIDRYGRINVESWYFEIWDAPELSNLFWYESKENFFKFYKETYFAMKKISSKLQIGSPGILPINNFGWFKDFLNYCKNNSIVINFVACHIYTTTDIQNTAIPKEILGNKHINLSMPDENYLQSSVISLKNILNSAGLNALNLFVTEWNQSPYTVDYTRDTCFQSSYIVHNILNNIDNIDSLGFWTLSDIMDQGITGTNLFHGGYGLFTRNSIKKPAFNAFYLLNRLGDNLVDHGKDYIITSKGSTYQILIYNFVYFDELFRTGDKSLLSYHERYNIFKSTEAKNTTILLTLEEGKYNIIRYSLNRESGSSFDAWLKMGAPEEMNNEMLTYLKSKEIPNISVSTEVVNGQLVLNDIIPVHGVLLIEIDRLI